MVLEFKLPDLGEGVAEGEIVKWLVTEGQQIKEDDPMVEVMTDKATVQIPSPTSGIVRQIVAKEGQTVKVGTNLVVLDISEESKNSPLNEKPATQTPQETSKPPKMKQPSEKSEQPISADSNKPVIATPATRKLARDLNINIERLKGSGPGGRVTENDVKQASVSEQRLEAPRQIERAEVVPPKERSGMTDFHQTGPREERVQIHGIRKRISDKMLKSTQETASVTHVDEVDFTELISLREVTRPIAEAQSIKLTFLPFIIKAITTTLKHFPYFNATIDDERQEFVIKRYYNIGVATDTPNGLIVPVVKDADKKDILEIAKDLERLSDDARNGRILLQDLQGGTFTVTNIGTLGGVISTPIINLPEVAILGVHKIQKKPIVLNNEIVVRDVAYVALTFDHRIVDGADAARFTSKLKKYLENPSLIFVEASLHGNG